MKVKQYTPLYVLKQISNNIWIVDGGVVAMNFKLFNIPFSTRMTIIRLNNGGLWVHSPINPNSSLLSEISKLGEVDHLVAPNVLHYSFIDEWHRLFPNAKVWLADGVKNRASKLGKDLSYGVSLVNPVWKEEIDFIVFEGSFYVKEAVFFHKKSGTLILTDLIENIETIKLSFLEKLLFAIGDNHYPSGKTPRDLRFSFIFSKRKARNSYQNIKLWNPQNVVISHGPCQIGNAIEFLNQAFYWLEK